VKWLGFACLLLVATTGAAQTPERVRTEALARKVNERIRALQREADQLAGEARTLVGDIRRLEIERDLQIERVAQAEAAADDAQVALERANARVAELEQQRVAQLPDLKRQLVDLYKQGRGGYVRLLLEADGVRDLGRTARAVSALVRIYEQRVEEHRRTVNALRAERTELERRATQLRESEEAARAARAASERAVAARAALIERIDAQRDLNAQLTGELQVAYERLQQRVADLAAGRSADVVILPLAPFRGTLDWPVVGPLRTRFGAPVGASGSEASRNGIEIAAPAGTPVAAVHGGTVGFAGAFVGFGNLVILDHGSNTYSLYGYLGSASVEQGQTVHGGDRARPRRVGAGRPDGAVFRDARRRPFGRSPTMA
jgi:septal ring factor EnvC (AmiA/AmiB activator)